MDRWKVTVTVDPTDYEVTAPNAWTACDWAIRLFLADDAENVAEASAVPIAQEPG